MGSRQLRVAALGVFLAACGPSQEEILRTRVAELESRVSELEQQRSEAESALTELESSLDDLDASLSAGGDGGCQDAVEEATAQSTEIREHLDAAKAELGG